MKASFCATALACSLLSLTRAVSLTSGSRETVQQAALHARTLLSERSDGLGTLMSVFPADYEDESLRDLAIGGMEYFATTGTGNLIVLAMPISKQIRNIIDSDRHNVTFAVKDELAYRKLGAYGATDRNRVTVFGSMHEVTDEAEISKAVRTFGKVHKDAKAYFPGKGPHQAFWAVIRVQAVYWVGGFGDTHYIGWIPLDMYRDAHERQWASQQDSSEDITTKNSRVFYQAGLID